MSIVFMTFSKKNKFEKQKPVQRGAKDGATRIRYAFSACGCKAARFWFTRSAAEWTAVEKAVSFLIRPLTSFSISPKRRTSKPYRKSNAASLNIFKRVPPFIACRRGVDDGTAGGGGRSSLGYYTIDFRFVKENPSLNFGKRQIFLRAIFGR